MDASTNGSMISSSDVNGTEVYNRRGEHVGTIDHLMIDKRSGKIGYAVMGFGGFLGMGQDHYPIPWGALTYDTGVGGYVTDIDKDRLEGAPVRAGSDYDRDWETRTYSHYGIAPYWL